MGEYDVEALLTSLAATDGLSPEDIEDAEQASDPAPKWVRDLGRDR